MVVSSDCPRSGADCSSGAVTLNNSAFSSLGRKQLMQACRLTLFSSLHLPRSRWFGLPQPPHSQPQMVECRRLRLLRLRGRCSACMCGRRLGGGIRLCICSVASSLKIGPAIRGGWLWSIPGSTGSVGSIPLPLLLPLPFARKSVCPENPKALK